MLIHTRPHNLFNPAEESEGLFEQCVVDIDNLETSSNWPGGRYTDNIELKHKSDFYVNSLPDSSSTRSDASQSLWQ